MDKFHEQRESVSIASRAMSVFLYGFKKEMGKSALKEGIGFRHGEFRLKVVKLMVHLTRLLPPELFPSDTLSDPSAEGGMTIGGKPNWLSSNMLNGAALALARKHPEWFASELPKLPSTQPKREALYISKRFSKVVVDMLRASRERSKVKMFEDGLYCLIDLESLKWFLEDLSNPSLSFRYPEEYDISPMMIPETHVGTAEEVRSDNSQLLTKVVSERKEMIVEAMYDVLVSKENTAQGRKTDGDREKKPLRKFINILKVSKSFLCVFCHLLEVDLLRANPMMLRNMYRFALVLRDIFVTHMPAFKRYQKPQVQRNNPPNNGTARNGQTANAIGSGQMTPVTERTESLSGDIGIAAQAGEANEDRNVPNETNAGEGESLARTPSSRSNAIPTITMEGLLPAGSEIDRILKHCIDISTLTYKRTNTGDDVDNNDNDASAYIEVDSDDGVDMVDLDSDDEGLSDMWDDVDETD